MKIQKAIILTVLYIFFIEFVPVWILLMEYMGIEDYDSYYYFINGGIQVIIVFLFIKIMSPNELFQNTNFKWYIIAFVLGGIFVWIQTPLNWVYNFIAGTEYSIVYDFEGYKQIDNLNYVAIIFLIPIGEELFFRQYIQKGLQIRFKPIIAIGIASLLFASIHLPYNALIFFGRYASPHLAYIALFGGMLSGVLFYKSKSIGPSIIMHVMWNLMVYVV